VGEGHIEEEGGGGLPPDHIVRERRVALRLQEEESRQFSKEWHEIDHDDNMPRQAQDKHEKQSEVALLLVVFVRSFVFSRTSVASSAGCSIISLSQLPIVCPEQFAEVEW
jgi:hypothetical protein